MASAIRIRRFQNSLAATGDFVTGEGVSTSQRANVNVLNDEAAFNPIGSTIAPEAHGAPWAQPVPVWLALVGLLIILKYVEEKNGQASDFASIRVGFSNFLKIWIIAVVSLNLGHWIFGYWRVPGISTLVLAA
jgi:hypothetical protein